MAQPASAPLTDLRLAVVIASHLHDGIWRDGYNHAGTEGAQASDCPYGPPHEEKIFAWLSGFVTGTDERSASGDGG